MNILLAFAPFIAFAVIDRLVGPSAGLIAGSLVSAALVARDAIAAGRSAKILEIGSLVLFGGLALLSLFGLGAGSIIGVRLCVDAGLLVIVLASMTIGRPFTLQYAREQVAPAFWSSPRFVKTNYVITGVWALAFLLIVVADLVLLYAPELPPRVGVLIIVAALVGAVKFTAWYPDRIAARTS